MAKLCVSVVSLLMLLMTAQPVLAQPGTTQSGASQPGASQSSTAAVVAQSDATQPIAMVVSIDGAIGPAISAHVIDAIHQAEQEKATVVVLQMNTPGGLSSAMREIIQAILASSVPVVGYVAPAGSRAASAGTYILYASHIAAMAPATNLGAATPVSIGGPSLTDFTGQQPDKKSGTTPKDVADKATGAQPSSTEGRKALNDAVAYIRTLAQKRGRNAQWAEQAVRSAATLTDAEALQKNVIDLIAPSIPALLKAIDGRKVEVPGKTLTLHTTGLSIQTIQPDWRTELLAVITNPTIAYILMMIGIYGLLLEGFNPGAIVPGVVGAICLLLALFAFQMLPINFAGLGLILLGVVLMVAEVFMPSFGALGLGGMAAFVFGSVMLMDTGVAGYDVSVGVIAAIAVGGAGLMLMTMYLLVKSRRHKITTGAEALQGATAEALEDFEGRGYVLLAGEHWSASCNEPVHKGDKLKVTGREGLTVTVKRI